MIQVTFANIVTIVLSTWLGFALLVGGAKLMQSRGGNAA